MSSPTEQQAEGTWKVFKGKVQEAWGALSGDDLDRFGLFVVLEQKWAVCSPRSTPGKNSY
jgi:hypothetical protein